MYLQCKFDHLYCPYSTSTRAIMLKIFAMKLNLFTNSVKSSILLSRGISLLRNTYIGFTISCLESQVYISYIIRKKTFYFIFFIENKKGEPTRN